MYMKSYVISHISSLLPGLVQNLPRSGTNAPRFESNAAALRPLRLSVGDLSCHYPCAQEHDCQTSARLHTTPKAYNRESQCSQDIENDVSVGSPADERGNYNQASKVGDHWAKFLEIYGTALSAGQGQMNLVQSSWRVANTWLSRSTTHEPRFVESVESAVD